MAIYKRGNVYWFKFVWRGERIRESTKQGNRRLAEQIEAARNPAAVSDQWIAQRQLQHHGWNRAQARFQYLNNPQSPESSQRNGMALRAEDRQRGKKQQPDEVLRSDVAAPGGSHLSVPILARVTMGL